MQTVDQIPQEHEPVKLLLIGDTKTGKSTYIAEAAISGFHVIFVDGDNGISAIRWACKSHPDALKRIHYFKSRRLGAFVQGMIRSHAKAPFKWLPDLDRSYGGRMDTCADSDRVWIIDASKLPIDIVFAVDGLTTMAADHLGIALPEQPAKLLDGTDQGVYGEASVALTYTANLLQRLPCHVIVHAHATKYEIWDKPKNTPGSEMKQGKMVLRETIDSPLSSSRPHGPVFATRFNHIGWLSVNGMGDTDIDFSRRSNRIGGGPPNKIASTKTLSFASLVGSVPTEAPDLSGFFRETTHGEFKKEK